jgi:hypothetical protein
VDPRPLGGRPERPHHLVERATNEAADAGLYAARRNGRNWVWAESRVMTPAT